METSGVYSSNYQFSASSAGSRRDVNYSCGSCGYDLNLNSSSRNTSTIGSKYGKSIKKGIISFFSIDENRFNQVEEFGCVPYFITKHSEKAPVPEMWEPHRNCFCFLHPSCNRWAGFTL